MTVKRLSGGGGQGRRPDAAIRGYHFYGQTGGPSQHEMTTARLQKAQRELGDIRKVLATQKNVAGSEDARRAIEDRISRIERNSETMRTANLPLPMRARAAAAIRREFFELRPLIPEMKRHIEMKIDESGRARAKPLALRATPAPRSLHPRKSIRGIRQRLCLLLDHGSPIAPSTVMADLSRVGHKGNRSGSGLADEESIAWVEARYGAAFDQLAPSFTGTSPTAAIRQKRQK